MILINFYIAGPSKILLILKTSGLSKIFITNSGSPRTNIVLQFIGHRTDIQTEKMKNINSSHNNKPPEKSRPKYRRVNKTAYNKWMKEPGQLPNLQ